MVQNTVLWMLIYAVLWSRFVNQLPESIRDVCKIEMNLSDVHLEVATCNWQQTRVTVYRVFMRAFIVGW